MLAEEIGKKIKSARRRKGLTQGQLAARVGLSDHSSISKIEKGNLNPSLEVIENIANALQVNCVVVFEDRKN
ncbi:MAG: XRE family transcriptional regulator [Acinetobacter sp.]|uniref:helix-turn-helix domain-containing protein n=1 Tax=Acinetobacter sp. TaxID=472 RepID=UPI000FAA4F19|nr:helix-turn-helix transcriptional regulator [Acinetobacter sp.]RUP41607.1 MAG: XRE family transcriptional regulator [Acinetobacter sp.]